MNKSLFHQTSIDKHSGNFSDLLVSNGTNRTISDKSLNHMLPTFIINDLVNLDSDNIDNSNNLTTPDDANEEKLAFTNEDLAESTNICFDNFPDHKIDINGNRVQPSGKPYSQELSPQVFQEFQNYNHRSYSGCENSNNNSGNYKNQNTLNKNYENFDTEPDPFFQLGQNKVNQQNLKSNPNNINNMIPNNPFNMNGKYNNCYQVINNQTYYQINDPSKMHNNPYTINQHQNGLNTNSQQFFPHSQQYHNDFQGNERNKFTTGNGIQRQFQSQEFGENNDLNNTYNNNINGNSPNSSNNQIIINRSKSNMNPGFGVFGMVNDNANTYKDGMHGNIQGFHGLQNMQGYHIPQNRNLQYSNNQEGKNYSPNNQFNRIPNYPKQNNSNNFNLSNMKDVINKIDLEPQKKFSASPSTESSSRFSNSNLTIIEKKNRDDTKNLLDFLNNINENLIDYVKTQKGSR